MVNDRDNLMVQLGKALLIVTVLAAVALRPSRFAEGDNAPAGPARENKQPRGAAEAGPEALGRMVRLPLPITGHVDEEVKRAIHRSVARLRAERKDPAAPITLILEFSSRPQQADSGSDFTRALSLANYLTSRELSDVKTVAYLPRSISGHALLVAIACDEIVMDPDATISDAGLDGERSGGADELAASLYEKIAARRRTIDVPLALGLLDRNEEVLKVKTEKGSEFVLKKDLDKFSQTRAIEGEPQVVFAKGEQRKLGANEARALGVARYLAADRMSLSKALGLPVAALEVDPQVEGALRAVTINITGWIDSKMADTRQLMIEKATSQQGVNMICLWIDSPGGDAEAAKQLAASVANLNPASVLTVAYVPHEALGAAALVAVSCDQLVMQKSARLGGGTRLPGDAELLSIRADLKNQRATQQGRSWSLRAALMDNKLKVNQYASTRTGVHDYFSDEELAQQSDKADWKPVRQVTLDGRPLQLTADEALRYGLVREEGVVDDFSRLKALYGLETDPTFVEPGWTDALVRTLASPGISVLLLIFGMAGLYIELKTPGMGVGGFVAAVSFVLFFWSNYLEQTASVLEIVLFVTGLAFLILEAFVLPGVGIFGLGGGLLVIASLVLASQTFVLPRSPSQIRELRDSLLVVGGAGVGLIAVALMLRRFLPRTSILQPMVLNPPEAEQAAEQSVRESLADFRHLVGTQGTTLTPLSPAGKARFGDEIVDVMSDGDWIEAGSAIEVVAVRGSRVEVAARSAGTR